MKLYKYQEDAVEALNNGKHICIAKTGAGKGAIMLHWLHNTGKKKCLIVTMASKRDSHDIENEADVWFPGWRQSQSSFLVISWQGLAKWWNDFDNRREIEEWAIAFDELHSSKAGVSSQRGKAFINITKRTTCWTGYTATPGEKWIEFYPYFVACRKIMTKSGFMHQFCNVQTYKGYPEIVDYYHEDVLKQWWGDVSDAVDTSEMLRDMPAESSFTKHFKMPKHYKEVAKTRINIDGEMLDTTMGYCHALRQLCASKEKLDWVSDFLEGLETNAVIFYNYIEEGNALAEVCKKQGRKVWRIGGGEHNIPTASTIGNKDIVLCQWVSGSASLNLQFINYWVSFTPNYGYATTVQAKGRIKRIGQTKPMFFYWLRCDNTIEDAIYKCLHNKEDFAEEVWSMEQ